MGTFSDQKHLELVYFIVKSSCYKSQIKYFLKSAAPEWAPYLKLWKFKERRGAQTSKYGTEGSGRCQSYQTKVYTWYLY